MMGTPEEAQAAIDGISGTSIDGRQVGCYCLSVNRLSGTANR